MSPERLRKVEELFHRASALTASEREGLLRAECAGDDELRREVESLLAFEDDEENLIASNPGELAAEMFSESKSAPLVGRSINQYKILSLLGAGGMGAVYLAEDSRLGRKVAVKVLTGEFAADATRRVRFFREAKSASALNHPNILTVHEIGETDGLHYIVTEHIDGRTLMRYVADERPALDSLVEIAAQIASALAAAHAGGIIHRDIKPDNVMVRNDGIVKVLDFGIAKLGAPELADGDAETIQQPAATMPGMIIGTPQYMSPEQARGQKIDIRTDIFSFGAVFYEMIAGRPAFSGATNMDIIGAVLKDEPKRLAEFMPGVSPDIERIVAKSLSKNRDERFQSFREITTELANARRTSTMNSRLEGETAILDAPSTAETDESFTLKKGVPKWIFAVASLLIAATAFGVWQSRSSSGGLSTDGAPVRPTEIISWASTPGEVYSAGAFSPDGNMIAFSSTRGGNGRQLWIKQTGPGEAVAVTKDEFANEQPVWSPNGEELAFYSTRGNLAGVWRIPKLGGSPVFIATLEDGGSLLRSWSKTNVIYIEQNGELFALPATGGELRQLTQFRAASHDVSSISVAPDEKRIAFATVEGESWSVWSAALDGTSAKKLFTTAAEIKNTAWNPDNRRIYYSAMNDGGFQVFATDVDAAPPKQITFGDRDSFVLDVSPDGRKLLFGSAKEESDVWKVALKDGAESVAAAGIDSELWASVSPDSRSIAYQSVKNLSQGNNLFSGRVMTKKLAGEEDAVEASSSGYSPSWSPDGQSVAFFEVAGKTHRLETVRVGGGQKQTIGDNVSPGMNTLLPYNRIQTSDYSWSPDGSRLAFVSRRGGNSDVWVAIAAGGEPIRLTANDAARTTYYCPRWAPDGRSVAFSTKLGGKKPIFAIEVADVETKAVRTLTQQSNFLRLLDWNRQKPGELLVVATDESETIPLQNSVTILRLDTTGSAPKPLLSLRHTYLGNIQLSPDGRQIAFAASRDGRDNIWTAAVAGGEPKRLTGNNDARLYFSGISWAPDGSFIVFGKQSRYSILSMLTNLK